MGDAATGESAHHVSELDTEDADEERAGRRKPLDMTQEGVLVHAEGGSLTDPGGETGGERLGGDAIQGGGQGRKRLYKSLSCNCWTTEDGEEEGGGLRGGEADITTPWHCDVCNIYFTSSQALGGHRMNSNDHKVRCEKFKSPEGASAAVCGSQVVTSTPRLSLHVYSNDASTNRERRARMPPMNHMAGFDRVIHNYPDDVRTAISTARVQSPAAFFSSCHLDVFKRHTKFGNLGGSFPTCPACVLASLSPAPASAFPAIPCPSCFSMRMLSGRQKRPS